MESETLESKVEFKNYLQDRKVLVQPVESSGKWANLLIKGEERRKDPFLLNKAKRSFQIPYTRQGQLVQVFDSYEAHYTSQFPKEKLTEQQFFEKILGRDLNVYTKGKDNFWRHDKDSRVTVDRDGLELDLRKPLDMIKYKILMAQDNIAKTYESRYTGNYEFVIVDQNKLVTKKLEETKVKSKAYLKLGDILGSEQKMINFVKASGKHVPIRVTSDWLKDQIVTLIESDYNRFLSIVEDELFEDRVFIYDAVKVGAIEKVASDKYALDNGKDLGSIRDAIHFFRDPEHQELKFRVQSQIDRVND